MAILQQIYEDCNKNRNKIFFLFIKQKQEAAGFLFAIGLFFYDFAVSLIGLVPGFVFRIVSMIFQRKLLF